MKVLVIGKMGSGKSTFATKLGKRIQADIIHLDKLYWKYGWIKIPREELISKLHKIMGEKEWIIDGNYKSTLEMRLEKADTVVFFDLPKVVCLYRAVRRLFVKSTLVNDKAAGVNEKISWDLIKNIIFYNRDDTLKKIRRYKDRLKIWIIKNEKDFDDVLQKLAS